LNIYGIEKKTHKSQLKTKIIKGEGNNMGRVKDMGVIS
jgi:hypothetical protein